MRRLVILPTIAFASCLAARGLALDTSKGPTGANHQRAHAYATGAGVPVGILDTVFFGIPTPHHLGDRLIAQYDFYNKTPSQSPDPLANPIDDHERLAADIIASHDPLNTGVAPQALIYNAAINDLNLQSRRAASAWLNTNHNISLFSLSAQFGPNTNGTGMEALYWDWFMHDKDALLVVASANTGGQIGIPADSFNGITVGAFDQATQARWTGSAYMVSGGAGGSEARGKPDILAPGVWVGDGISFDGFSSLGTSFAAPHAAGAAALLMSLSLPPGAGSARNPQLPLPPGAGSASIPQLPLPPGEGRGEGVFVDVLDHRGIKALLLNSARKRHIAGPELLSPVSNDSAPAHATFDKDYLDCSMATCHFGDAASAGLAGAWTPGEWTYSAAKFSATKPLDDEQGAGYLDATRAIINLAGGNFSPGPVPGIGWDQGAILPADPAAAHTYEIDQTIAAGSFLTATLAWDRIALESDNDGLVEDDDAYVFGELANLDLRILNAANQTIAESISTTDNVEHLHVPLPTNGHPGDYKLQVVYNGGGLLATDFALAWWTSPMQLVPGDYNLDGTVNAQDYEVWRANFGTTTAASPLVRGDGNNDGSVDAADYVVWRQNSGETWVGGAHTLVVVPECSTMLLALIAIALAFSGCRRSPFVASISC